jgi:subtilisin family serine protease
LKNNEWTDPYPDLSGDLHGWNYVADSPEVRDEQGHGTAVAGIIAAEGDNKFDTTERINTTKFMAWTRTTAVKSG